MALVELVDWFWIVVVDSVCEDAALIFVLTIGRLRFTKVICTAATSIDVVIMGTLIGLVSVVLAAIVGAGTMIVGVIVKSGGWARNIRLESSIV